MNPLRVVFGRWGYADAESSLVKLLSRTSLRALVYHRLFNFAYLPDRF
jgi:hypothetical protein